MKEFYFGLQRDDLMWNSRIKPIHISYFYLELFFLILILLNLFYFLFSDRFDTYSADPEMTLYYSEVMPLRLNVPEEWEITESPPGDPGGVSICGLSIYIYQTPNQSASTINQDSKL